MGNGDKALISLGQYLYKGVVQEKDILKSENGMITFRYFDSRTKQWKTRTVTGEHFLYLLMLHVLPKGFRKTRCYGFLHPCSKKIIQLLQLILRFNPKKKDAEKNQKTSKDIMQMLWSENGYYLHNDTTNPGKNGYLFYIIKRGVFVM